MSYSTNEPVVYLAIPSPIAKRHVSSDPCNEPLLLWHSYGIPPYLFVHSDSGEPGHAASAMANLHD
jgi:hypothetical protein